MRLAQLCIDYDIWVFASYSFFRSIKQMILHTQKKVHTADVLGRSFANAKIVYIFRITQFDSLPIFLVHMGSTLMGWKNQVGLSLLFLNLLNSKMVLLQNHSVGDTFFTLVGFISINFQINKEINASQTHGPKSGAFFSWGYKSYGLEGIKGHLTNFLGLH